jgi:hypothetical protein
MQYELNKRIDSENGRGASVDGIAPLAIDTSAIDASGLLSSGVANLVNSVVGLLP